MTTPGFMPDTGYDYGADKRMDGVGELGGLAPQNATGYYREPAERSYKQFHSRDIFSPQLRIVMEDCERDLT